VLVLSGAQVEALLDLGALIDALGPAMAELSAGRAQAPERVGVRAAGGGVLLAIAPAAAGWGADRKRALSR
jgi:alanine dehydrogenase